MKGIGKIVNGGLKTLGTAEVLNMGLNLYFTGSDYVESREKGDSRLMAATKAVGTNIMLDVIGVPTYLGYLGLTELPKLGVKGYESLAMQARSMSRNTANKPFQNATFVDSQQAVTMRQAGMQLAKASKYNTQQAMLGNEAMYLHY